MTEEKGNISSLAALFNLTPDGVYDLRRRNIIPRPLVEGEWAIAACTKKYIAYLQTKHSDAGKGHRETILANEAEQTAMTTATMRGTLCRRSDCMSDIDDMQARWMAAIRRHAPLPICKKILADFKKIPLPDFKSKEEKSE